MAKKYPKCTCGRKMTQFDGWAWYTCPYCGNSIRDNRDGTWSWYKDLFTPPKGDIDPEDWRDFEEGWRPNIDD